MSGSCGRPGLVGPRRVGGIQAQESPSRGTGGISGKGGEDGEGQTGRTSEPGLRVLSQRARPNVFGIWK